MSQKKWTLMFLFASDNPLAPEVVSQLKAIKQAGFHQDVNVVAQFDPNPENVDTHIFDVNRVNKIQAARREEKNKIGFIGFKPNDPYVVNLMSDKIWGEEVDLRGNLIRDRIVASLAEKGFDFNPPPPPARAEGELSREGEVGPQRSLASFLKFCSDNYPADHYVLFVIGHGLVVGNDTFLFDENAPEHFLSLKTLREELEKFKGNIEVRDGVQTGAKLELISFHSCSLSSLEVACELRGIANYMLASQSPSFVGSWPYRQILIRVFNYQERINRGRPEVDIKGLLKNIFHYCQYNAIDFQVAGYSSDLCLCDLNKVSEIEGAVSDLSIKLIAGLGSGTEQTGKQVREHILLSHLKAQSYFNENYSDLFDFCFCLRKRLETASQTGLPAELQAVSAACDRVMEVLQRGVEGNDDRLIVRSEFVGPAYQYSHGLSIYFPWSKPIKTVFWPEEYDQYRFIKNARPGQERRSWSDFLATYFEETRRDTRLDEFTAIQAPGVENETRDLDFQEELLEAVSTGVFNTEGQLDHTEGKPGPDSSQGSGCDCQSIKNFPLFTRKRQAREIPDGKVPVLPGSLQDPTFTLNDEERPTFALDGI